MNAREMQSIAQMSGTALITSPPPSWGCCWYTLIVFVEMYSFHSALFVKDPFSA